MAQIEEREKDLRALNLTAWLAHRAFIVINGQILRVVHPEQLNAELRNAEMHAILMEVFKS